MTTRRIYHEDPEARTFVAIVEDCRPGPDGYFDVVLDRTAFYPTGGGQPHDTGMLAGLPVVDVLEAAGRIVHRVRGRAVSGEVEGVVDWTRRIDHRQQHTGQHILSRACLASGEAATIGFHLGQDTCTIDLDRELDEAAVVNAERLANDIVMADQPVADRWYETPAHLPPGLRKDPDVDGPIRIVSIGSFDATPCGGTHCQRSGQVGSIKILGTERRRGGLRVEFVCGYRALDDYGRRHQALRNAARLLSTEELRLPERVQGLLDDLKAQRTRLDAAEGAMRESWIKDLAQEPPGPLARVLGDARVEWLGPMAATLSDKRNAPTLLATSAEGEARVVMAVPEGSSLNAGQFLRELLVRAGGKGGGAERSGQGKLPPDALSSLIDAWTQRVSEMTEKGTKS
jgi:alanyl-tRNA synthetase